jgi:protoporphyrinogen/coproporphyrinogen III oxidase
MERVVIVGGGVSGLATAFGLQRGARAAGRALQVTVLEAEGRAGGKMRTDREDGFVIEWGPNGFLDSKVHAVQLVGALGAGDVVLKASLAAKLRFITRDGRLCLLPESPVAFLRSPLISASGKARLFQEPFAPGPPPGEDETLADFARRRIGPEALDYLIDPMVSGVFAGNPEELSLAAVFPRMVELERQYGGLVKALVAIGREKRRERRRARAAAGETGASGGPAGPSGTLTSFRGGVQTFVDLLVSALEPGTLVTGARVERVRRSGACSVVEYRRADGSSESRAADAVVLSCPAYDAADLLSPDAPGLADLLRQIPYAPISVVATAYRAADVAGAVQGFGFLHPRREGRRTLGTLWDSCVFGDRAPAGHALLRTMVGGARAPAQAFLSDDALVAAAAEDLRDLAGIRADPVKVRVYRHDRGIPQYVRGHLSRLEAIDRHRANWPGLHLCSNAYRGIALGDCCREAERTTSEILAAL